MKRKAGYIILMCSLAIHGMTGQESYFRPGFSQAVIINPALSGAAVEGTLRMSYASFLPGKNFGLNSAAISWDFYSDFLHGGVALYAASDITGEVFNYTGGGVSYAYHLKAGRELYVNAGLGASVRHTGINRKMIVLPDQIDPMAGNINPSGDIVSYGGRTYFDVATGFLVSFRNYSAALSVNHLTKPDAAGGGLQGGQLQRRLTMFAWAEYNLDRQKKYKLKPVLFADLSGRNFLISGNTVLSAGQISLNGGVSASRAGDINIRSGLTFRLFNTSFFYSYGFNLRSHNRLLPFNVNHEGGISLSLNNVDKRSAPRAINFPEL